MQSMALAWCPLSSEEAAVVTACNGMVSVTARGAGTGLSGGAIPAGAAC